MIKKCRFDSRYVPDLLRIINYEKYFDSFKYYHFRFKTRGSGVSFFQENCGWL